MSGRSLLSRRIFLRRLGRATFAVSVFGLAACSDPDTTATSTAAPTTTGTEAPATTTAPTTTSAPTTTGAATTTAATTQAPGGGEVAVERVNLGFVSAYILARGGEAAVVDTGVPGSAGAIEEGLAAISLGWSDVGHVILTHLHGDHIGSLGDVMNSATAATGYAGAADIPGIPSPRELVAVGDGDQVFGLDVIATPGHTPGHICVLERVGGVLVAGDAVIGQGGGVAGPDPQFATDLDLAHESVRKLAAFEFETILFGHGEPVSDGGGAVLAALAAQL